VNLELVSAKMCVAMRSLISSFVVPISKVARASRKCAQRATAVKAREPASCMAAEVTSAEVTVAAS